MDRKKLIKCLICKNDIPFSEAKKEIIKSDSILFQVFLKNLYSILDYPQYGGLVCMTRFYQLI